MSLALVLRSVRTTVQRHEPVFQRARLRATAFGAYATAAHLLEAVSPGSPLALRERDPLVRAVLREHQAAPHDLWQALLLRAFEPMLRRARKRAYAFRDDADQRVLFAFLQAVRPALAAGQPAFLAIRRATTHHLFDGGRADVDTLDEVPFDEQLDDGVPTAHADPQPFVACLAGEIVDWLVQRPGGADVACVLAGFETTEEQAGRRAADKPGARGRRLTSACLRQRKQRVLADLRRELARVPRRAGS